jgi:hypothetical protein
MHKSKIQSRLLRLGAHEPNLKMELYILEKSIGHFHFHFHFIINFSMGLIPCFYYVTPLQVGLEGLGSAEDQILRLAC